MLLSIQVERVYEARGSLEAPGRNVRAKAGLNRGILKSGWGLLAGRLEQKAPGRVEKVKAAYTSQTCNACKHVASASRGSQDFHGSGVAHGRSVTARGDRVKSARSVKREPQRARPPKVA